MPKTKTPSKPRPFLPLWTALALLLLWLISGCATQPQTLQPSLVRGVQLPPLPAVARQGATPSVCLPTCLDALTSERESWLILLTPGTSQAAPVNGPTMR